MYRTQTLQESKRYGNFESRIEFNATITMELEGIFKECNELSEEFKKLEVRFAKAKSATIEWPTLELSLFF